MQIQKNYLLLYQKLHEIALANAKYIVKMDCINPQNSLEVVQMRKVKYAIVGAGTSGLTALGAIRKQTDDFVIINGGHYGTTCARVGCMPSKALIHSANHFYETKHFEDLGIQGAQGLLIDQAKVMQRVRGFRDRFTGGIKASTTDDLGDKRIDGYAKFVDQMTLQVNDEIIQAERIILATGSSPVIPKPWQAIGDKLLTSDEIFEQDTLPKRVAVIGLGVIGLELGQAMARLGCDVTGVEMLETLGGLSSPEAIDKAKKLFSQEIDLHLGQAADISLNPDNSDEVLVKIADKTVVVDAVLASLGRSPNLSGLDLPAGGIEVNERGMPDFDLHSAQIQDLPVFIAGDLNGYRQILHEAGDEGRMAVSNAMSFPEVTRFERKTALGVAFTDPQIGLVGARISDSDSQKTEKVVFNLESNNGRAIVNATDKGTLVLVADKASKRLVGAELFMADAEHLSHMLAWVIQQKMTVLDILRLPFYHPVMEEALQSALRELSQKIYSSQEIEAMGVTSELTPLL